MRLSKKVVSLVCLTSMMLGFDSSSKGDITHNSSLNSIEFDSYKENTITEKSIVKSSTQDLKQDNITSNINNDSESKEKELSKEDIENKRKDKITYCRQDITVLSGITETEMKNILMNYTGASTMAHLSGALIDCEKLYGVNAFTMAAIVALESGFATSRRAVEDNNLTGYEVYSDDSEGRLFSSQYESIVHTARHLSKNYLSKDGMYYRGLSVDDVQVNYCPDEGKGKNWNGKINKLATGFLKTYKELYL